MHQCIFHSYYLVFSTKLVGMINFIKNILKTFINGSIINTSYYLNYIFIITGLIDSILYSICFYLSNNELPNQQISKPISETVELLIRTQNDLFDSIKDLVRDNTTGQMLIQNSLNKLTTLEFVQKDGLMTIKKNINQSLGNSILTNSYLINRIYFYICTFSFLLFICQIILWIFNYLTLKNPKKYLSYLFILSIVILSQSLGLIYFFHITNTCRYLFWLYIYTWIFFIRNLLSIYYQTF